MLLVSQIIMTFTLIVVHLKSRLTFSSVYYSNSSTKYFELLYTTVPPIMATLSLFFSFSTILNSSTRKSYILSAFFHPILLYLCLSFIPFYQVSSEFQDLMSIYHNYPLNLELANPVDALGMNSPSFPHYNKIKGLVAQDYQSSLHYFNKLLSRRHFTFSNPRVDDIIKPYFLSLLSKESASLATTDVNQQQCLASIELSYSLSDNVLEANNTAVLNDVTPDHACSNINLSLENAVEIKRTWEQKLIPAFSFTLPQHLNIYDSSIHWAILYSFVSYLLSFYLMREHFDTKECKEGTTKHAGSSQGGKKEQSVALILHAPRGNGGFQGLSWGRPLFFDPHSRMIGHQFFTFNSQGEMDVDESVLVVDGRYEEHMMGKLLAYSKL